MNKKWKDFRVIDILGTSTNSVAHHSESLTLAEEKGIPYITRTSYNNGLSSIVNNKNYQLNPANSISFGAENAEFFYQPFKYITGNKMYYYKSIDKEASLFLVECLNYSIKNCGFGYGMGLTGTRMNMRKFMLPVDDKDRVDEQYIKDFVLKVKQNKIKLYVDYITNKLKNLTLIEIPKLNEKKWKEFFLTEIFEDIQRGKRLTKSNQKCGYIPYVSSTSLNNGVDNYISNNTNVRKYKDCLSLANSGSVGSCFYHKYEFVASDHITHLKNDNLNEFSYLFISALLSRLSEKYNFNREMNDKRIKREKVLLPINDEEKPDFAYMEQYIKNLIIIKANNYLKYKQL